jgi:N-acylneuraminate cytidylyltransferase
MLQGKPMIAYTIEAAVASELFDQVIVSTDSEEISKVAIEYGAEVPFLRDAGLADDHTPVSLATLDVLLQVDPAGERYSTVAQLMPNCPLRTAEDIRRSYDQFSATGSDSQISVTRFGWQTPWWAMSRDQNYRLKPTFEDLVTQRSQDLPELFCPTGAIWWATAEALKREETFHMPGRTGWEIPWQRAVDIDTEDDWTMAELLMQGGPRSANAYV